MNQVGVKSKLNIIRSSEKLWEYTYLIILGIVIARDAICTTMLELPWLTVLSIPLYLATAGYAGAKFLWYKPKQREKQITTKERIGMVVIATVFALSALISGYHFLWEVGFLIIGAKGIPMEKILNIYVGISISVMLLAFVAAQAGIIENLVFPSERGGERYCYGSIYPTDFSAHIFYLLLVSICANKRNVLRVDIFISILLAFLVYTNCIAYTSALCIAMFTFVLFLYWLASFHQWKIPFEKTKKIWGILCIVPLACCVMFWWLSYNFNPLNEKMSHLNQLLSFRLELSKQGIEKYGLSWLGKMVPEFGFGGLKETTSDYFFLDDSYIRIGIEYGILVLILVLVILTILIWKGIQNKRLLMVFALVIICIHSIMEQHLLELAYNPFILLLYTKLHQEENITKEKNKA